MTPSRAARTLAWAACALAACTPNIHLEPDGGGQPTGGGGSGGVGGHAGGPEPTVVEFPQAGNRDIDILFMIDDSSSMSSLQNKLRAAFPTFVDTLKMLPGGMTTRPSRATGAITSARMAAERR